MFDESPRSDERAREEEAGLEAGEPWGVDGDWGMGPGIPLSVGAETGLTVGAVTEGGVGGVRPDGIV